MLNKILVNLLLFSVFTIVYSKCENVESSSLHMVHVLFRHGERTTEHFYPTDPHINNTFYPIGLGSLTNTGKLQEFKLGQYLRRRYGDYLGDIYSSEMMEIRATDFIRTRMSALLVAAGLWAHPSKAQMWSDHLSWIPIPVDYKPYDDEDLLNPGRCKKRIDLLNTQREIEDVKKNYITPHMDLMKFIEEKSGKRMQTPMDLLEIYLIFQTELETNLTLPNWTNTIFPEPLYSAASLAYRYNNFNPEIRTVNAGYFLEKILHDKLKDDGTEVNKKISLYAAHESTLGHVLDVLKVKAHIAPYGSVILFEIHKTDVTDKFALKIFYRRGIEDDSKLEDIMPAACPSLCDVNQFEKLYQDVLPKMPYKDACNIIETY